jgi:hydrogenase maturation protein HypF
MPAIRIKIKGIVQGVGFRPFVYNLAQRCRLRGFVLNDTAGVEIEAEGLKTNLDRFLHRIKTSPPPLSRIEQVSIKRIPSRNFTRFAIRESKKEKARTVLISPDLATCDDCLSELFDPQDRRYGYPFLNCTNCGPRLTIVRDVPYDRNKTTMEKFRMCPECEREYHDPENRRFHAQPNACPVCGPRLTLMDNQGKKLAIPDPVAHTITLLKQGNIVAVKGIGGYHLAADATNSEAVRKLRKRKYREDKPFALMTKDIKTIRKFCCLNPLEKKLLQSVSRPILLLRKKDSPLIAPQVAPFQKSWGVMLPYTPLHHLLLDPTDLILVMTSANQSDEPIAYQDDDALMRLNRIADYFLMHDREIFRRCDDSVSRVWNGKEMILRRGRGYVPLPMKVNEKFHRHILAVGAQLKNTFCLARDNFAFLSTHIGDLENFEVLEFYEKEIARAKRLCSVKPRVVAYDLHPEYLSTKYGQSLTGVKKIPVQHHHAHIASCMADNNIDQKVIGVAFDGTGYGEDQAVWGGEFLIADLKEFKRAAHLEYIPMPGGEMAIHQPWRMTAVYLYACYGEDFLSLDLEFVKRLNRDKWSAIKKMLNRKINLFPTSSLGRLFDAVSVLLNWRDAANYEGQPAIELETWADEKEKGNYPFEIKEENDILILCPERIITGVVKDLGGKNSKARIAAKFHNSIAQMTHEACLRLRKEYGLNSVCLSGGVFQNVFLLDRTYRLLAQSKFQIYTHHQVPPNDGGISLGQAVIANQRI